MHTHYSNVKFLVLILYDNYVRQSHWEKLGDGYRGPLCSIFPVNVKIQLFQNKKVKTKNKTEIGLHG